MVQAFGLFVITTACHPITPKAAAPLGLGCLGHMPACWVLWGVLLFIWKWNQPVACGFDSQSSENSRILARVAKISQTSAWIQRTADLTEGRKPASLAHMTREQKERSVLHASVPLQHHMRGWAERWQKRMAEGGERKAQPWRSLVGAD